MKTRKKTISIFLFALLTVFSLLIGMISPVLAYDTLADGSTAEKYSELLGNTHSTLNTGKVWTDKTVYDKNDVDPTSHQIIVDGNEIELDSDFLVSYSALSSAQSITGQTEVPLDVVFVLDLSGSMQRDFVDGERRIKRAVDAINVAIEKILSLNANTRIGVVGFNEKAEVLLPLDHFSKRIQNGTELAYFSLKNNGSVLVTNAKQSNGVNITNQESAVSGGTNTQAGMSEGMKLLENANSTTININGKEITRIPSVVLVSDGNATFSLSDSNWWNPNINSSNQGTGMVTDPFAGNAMKSMLTAAYKKITIDNHYHLAKGTTKVYTLGMGITLLTGDDRESAEVSLNPSVNWEFHDFNRNGIIISKEIRDAWNTYLQGGTPSVRVNRNSYNDFYQITHPNTGINLTFEDLKYVEKYYSTEHANEITEAFQEIIESIILAAVQSPTEIETGKSATNSGYITYIDPIGEYMEVKDVKAIIFNGQKYEQKTMSTSNDTTTYIFEGNVDHSIYKGVSLNHIIIEVQSITSQISATETVKKQTMTIKIPAALIPLRINEITLNNDEAENNKVTLASPIRVLYTVGLQSSVNPETLEGVSDSYIENHTVNTIEDNKKVNFYSNLYTKEKEPTGTTIGNTTATFTPASSNASYYIPEGTVIYSDNNCTQVASSIQNENTYYYKKQYYETTNGITQRKEIVLEVQGMYLNNQQVTSNLENVRLEKEINSTSTANNASYSKWKNKSEFVTYLGNNGVLGCPLPAKQLTIQKLVTADSGLIAPEKTFTFEVTIPSKANQTVIAKLREGSKEIGTQTVNFDSNGLATMTLKANQSLDIPLVRGTYSIKEIKIPEGFELTNTTHPIQGNVSSENVIEVFTNHYKVQSITVQPTELGLEGTKTIIGRNFKDLDTFTFKVSAIDQAPLCDPNEITIQPTNGTVSTISGFGNFKFEKPGTYQYYIQEQIPQTNALAGVTYDLSIYRLTVVVSDNGKGTLSVTNHFIEKANEGNWNTVEDGRVNFENIYNAKETSINISGIKTFENKTITDGQFEFMLVPLGSRTLGSHDEFVHDMTQPIVTNNISNVGTTLTFDSLTFGMSTIGKEYKYLVKEKQPTIDGTYEGIALEGAKKDSNNNWVYQGITYDQSSKEIIISVTTATVNGEESVVATLSSQSFEFVNSYHASAETTLSGIKTITGRKFQEGDTFTFNVAVNENSSEDTPLPQKTQVTVTPTSSNQVNVDFGKITFTKAGTYIYSVTESMGTLGGVTYDTAIKTVTMVVTDQGDGTMRVETTYSTGENLTWNNTYTPTFDDKTAVSLKGSKTLTGLDLTKDMFTFSIEAIDGAPLNGGATLVSNEADGTFTILNEVKYTKAGTYEYLVKEVIPETLAKGMTYDQSMYKVSVEVIDQLDGTLIAKPVVITKSMDNGKTYETAASIHFLNTYEPLETIHAPVVTKVLEGYREEGLKAEEFSFEMSLVSAQPVNGVILPTTLIQTNDALGKVQFDQLTFYAAGTYVIKIKEMIPETKLSYIDYDTHELEITYVVNDEQGQLVVNTSVKGEETFTNTYKTTGSVIGQKDLEVSKDLQGRGWQEGDIFNFELVVENEATKQAIKDGYVVISDDKVSIDDKDEDKKASFGNITMTKPGEYYFTIREEIPENKIAGLSYDSTTRSLRVVATDQNNGTLKVETTILSEKGLSFVNRYSASAETTLSGIKAITGRDFQEGDTFTFNVAVNENSSEDTPLPQKTQVTVTPTSSNQVNVDFGKITFTKAGTYIYSVTESMGTLGGVTYDTAIKTVTMVVTDQGDGTMRVETTYSTGENLTWNNTYTPTFDDKTAVSLKGSKTLTGLDLTKDMFTFSIEAIDGAPLNGGATLVSNEADGTFTILNEVKYTKAGTYEYLVKEVIPETLAKGMTYDQSMYKVSVEVIDQLDGTLIAKPVVITKSMDNGKTYETAASIHFLNTYEPLETIHAPVVTKVLEGYREEGLKAEEFSFEMSLVSAQPVNGVILPTTLIQTNDALGKVQFDQLTFNAVGTYVIKIKEMIPETKLSYIDYDTHELEITYVVNDEQGQLVVNTSVKGEETFTNTYKTTGSVIGKKDLEVSKDLQGRGWQEGDIFNFELVAENEATKQAIKDGYVVISDDKVSIDDKDEDKKASFGNITITKPGEYYFTIREDISNPISGITYASPKTVKVIATDKNDGIMDVSVVVENNATLTFTNTYQPSQTTLNGEVNLKVTKDLQGRDWLPSDLFEFVITPMKDYGHVVMMSEPTSLELTSSTQQSSFGDIVFKEAGTYQFEIKEKVGTILGMHYDTKSRIVTVNVSDNYDGTLSASVDHEKSEMLTFKNTYQPNQTVLDTNLQITKILEGRNWKVGDVFNFELMAGNDETEQAIEDETVILPENATDLAIEYDGQNGQVKKQSFGDIIFKQAGSYVFHVKEIISSQKILGITYDSSIKTVTILVSDNLDGTLTAKVVDESDDLIFTNVYQPNQTTLDLHVQKNFVGRPNNEWLDTDTFKFTIAPKADYGDAVMMLLPMEIDINNQNKNSVSFGNIVFKKAGTYRFEVKEIYTGISGVAYDLDPREIVVEVVDHYDGTLTAQLTKESQSLVFNNTYGTDSVILEGKTNLDFTKVVTGRDWLEDESFTFIIEALTENAPLPNETEITVTKSWGNSSEFNFGDIVYTQSDLQGKTSKEFVYVIKEIKGNKQGMTYDTHEVKVKVTVVDDGKGKLTLGTTIEGLQVFENKYHSELTYQAAGGLNLTKQLIGHDMENQQFSFEITALDQKSASKLGINEGRSMMVQTGAAKDGESYILKPFENIIFTQDDANQQYQFTISELIPDFHPGYDYDSTVYTVTIDVVDHYNGMITVKTTVNGNGETQTYVGTKEKPCTAIVPFVNYYHATGQLGGEGQVQIEATKTLNGKELNDHEFSFAVKDKGMHVVATGTNDSDGTIEFTPIVYTTESLKQAVENGLTTKKVVNGLDTYEFQYSVVENTEGLAEAGITPTASSFEIRVIVTDHGDGTITPVIDVPEGGLQFVNTYATNAVPVKFAGRKTLVLSDPNLEMSLEDIAGQFTFTITGVDENGNPAPLPNVTSVTNDAAGNVVFGEVVYHQPDDLNEVEPDENGVRSKAYTYTVTETGHVDGVVNDVVTSKTFVIILQDDGQGNLIAMIRPNSNTMFNFDNTYHVVPSLSSITDQILLTKHLIGRPMIEGEFEFVMMDKEGQVVARGTNAIDGAVAMSAIQFDTVGTYSYDVIEVHAGETENGVTYDEVVYHVEATVSDNKDGTLSVMWNLLDAQEMVFDNSYVAQPTALTLAAVKTLKGRDLLANEFYFELKDENGNVLQTKTNDEKGGILFDEMTFDKVGTYQFTISEIKGDLDHVTYDETIYHVIIKITDNGKGYLESEIICEESGIVFTNKYEEPKPEPTPEPITPSTSDDYNIKAYGLLLVASLAGIVGIRKKAQVSEDESHEY